MTHVLKVKSLLTRKVLQKLDGFPIGKLNICKTRFSAIVSSKLMQLIYLLLKNEKMNKPKHKVMKILYLKFPIFEPHSF